MARLRLLPFVFWLGVSLVTAQSEEFTSTAAPTTTPALPTTQDPTTSTSTTTTITTTTPVGDWLRRVLQDASDLFETLGEALGIRRKRRASFSITVPDNNTIVLSSYCGLGTSMKGTPTTIYTYLVDYYLSLNTSSDPEEVECMTLLLAEFVALVENGMVSFPPSDMPIIQNATENVIEQIGILLDELDISLSTMTPDEETPDEETPPHKARRHKSKMDRLSIHIIQNVVLA
ncbi:uncharacterized protein LOC135213442 isoform X2 [Macrobrachium nipponense]|uniref:uncharacterized protein LOC135213442 isoform X2 n=1 Tax=Macrobrachium nipponense TaxID=159736 RepID=UPI0030C8CEE1